MTGIVEFLTARLNEDEHVIREHAEYWGPMKQRYDSGLVSDHEYHSVIISPARVLADVEAKRKIIERYERALTVIGAGSTLASFTRGQDDGYRQGCLDALYDLALPYADHPDYDPTWRP